MRLHFVVAAGVLASANLSLSPLIPQARADTFTVSILQSGQNVVATGSGALSVSGSNAGFSTIPGARPDPPLLFLGTGPGTAYTGVTGPSSFGVGGPAEAASSATGGSVGFDTFTNRFFVPDGYIAGTALTSSDTWMNLTLRDLGFATGTYNFTLGSGDAFVIDIGPQPSISPEPSTFALLGTGVLGAIGVLRKRFA